MITSTSNAHLKLVRKLAERRGRRAEGAFVVEGEDLVLAGIECGASARVLLVDAERTSPIDAALVGCDVISVEPKLLASVSELAHPPRVIGVFDVPSTTAEELASGSRAGFPMLVLDGVTDPGNVGTIIRSAAAFGASGVLLTPGSGDPLNGKAIRASMGAVFRVRFAAVTYEQLASFDIESLIALDAEGTTSMRDAARDVAASGASAAIVIGAERDGVSPDLRALASVTASIPQDLRVESVNASVAASIALYECAIARQGSVS
jgi:TrmH family RNA methyltransferase